MGFTAFFGGLLGGHHQTATSTPMHNREDSATSTPWQGGERMTSGIFGTVSAINGTTLTIDGRSASSTPASPELQRGEATTTYSVDASSAKILKGSATSTISVSAITVGDKVIVQGTVTGTSVVAKLIVDGLPPRMMGGRPAGRPSMMGSTTPRILHSVQMPGGFSAQEEGSESGSEASSE